MSNDIDKIRQLLISNAKKRITDLEKKVNFLRVQLHKDDENYQLDIELAIKEKSLKDEKLHLKDLENIVKLKLPKMQNRQRKISTKV